MKCVTNVHFREVWTLTNLHCPFCTGTTVWESSEDDVELGPISQCATCGGSFYMAFPADADGIEKAKAIREAEHILEPSDSIAPAQSSHEISIKPSTE